MASGFVAGLLGIGGGLFFVPLLLWTLPPAVVPVGADAMHFAVATSLAVIVPTALTSFLTHARHDGIIWPVLRCLAFGIVPGALAGASTAAMISGNWLRLFYAVFALHVAWRLWRGSVRPLVRRRPVACGGHGLAGGAIGLVSAWLGIGGGTLTTPWLLGQGIEARKAIATSAACGLPLALVAAVTYALGGPLMQHGTGLVYWPAVLPLVIGSMTGAAFGARQTHRWPQQRLRQGLALLLLVIAVTLFV